MPPPQPCLTVEVKVEQEFEESLELSWQVTANEKNVRIKEYHVEMVIDRSDANNKGPLQPCKDAMVKSVSMGTDVRSTIQNMPVGRNFLVSAVCELSTREKVRSKWVRASTLKPGDREADLGNIDPANMPRTSCLRCPCPCYVALRFTLNSTENMRCRRCGCMYSDHTVVEVEAILKAREAKAKESLGRKSVEPLPPEALDWDTRECSLWFCSDGAVHPRTTVGLHRPAVEKDAKVPQGGPEGLTGRKGRVSVVTPTTESRHAFHEVLWKCFEAQKWPDKELVVVETYVKHRSEFFADLAAKDPRVVYAAFQRPADSDWSIGLKRNIGAHLATGEFIANFDDDDLYAPVYLASMVTLLQSQRGQAITLSSWFIFDHASNTFGFCDPIAWGLAKGLDQSSKEVREKVYGYGFSYVFYRKAGLDLMYEDMNLGEDFVFITQLQRKRGASSCALFHDDFGICLHVQHGGNTSNSILLRDVDKQEALDLDIMELAPHFHGEQKTRTPAERVLSWVSAKPPCQRQRSVHIHAPTGGVELPCAVNATVSDILSDIEERLGGSPGSLLVYRAPPDGEADAAARDDAAIDVLGLRFLAEMPGAEHNIRPDSSCGKEWRQLLEQARLPMSRHDRIGLRTTDLWVRPRESGAAEATLEEDGEPEEFFTVHVTCQKSTVKKFFSVSGALQVRLPVGAVCRDLRDILGGDLPRDGRVLVENPGQDPVVLKESDALPDMVTLTDFKGRRSFYMRFTPRQARTSMRIVKAFWMRPENAPRIADMKAQARGDSYRHSILISKVLADETYPIIIRHMDMPQDQHPLQMVMDAMVGVGTDYEASRLWFETEVLMQNRMKMEQAYFNLKTFHEKCPDLGPLPPKPWESQEEKPPEGDGK